MTATATANGRGVRGALTSAVAMVALAVVAFGSSCASTEMTSTWVDPTAKGSPLSKIAVVALTPDPGLRRMAENTAATQMEGVQAIPSYQILGDTDLKNRELVKAKLRAAGFDGVLVMRIAGVSEQVSPAGPYGTFDGYYDWAAAPVYAPGDLQTETVVRVVSNLYSLNQNKLVWSGVSETFDPANSKDFVKGVSKAVAKSMQKDRVVL